MPKTYAVALTSHACAVSAEVSHERALVRSSTGKIVTELTFPGPEQTVRSAEGFAGQAPKLLITPRGFFPAEGEKIIGLLQDSKKFEAQVHPLRRVRLGISTEGNRGLMANVDGMEGIVVFSGIGKVAISGESNGEILISPVETGKSVREVYPRMNSSPSLTSDGKFLVVPSDAPFGGYFPNDLLLKFNNMQAAYTVDPRLEPIVAGGFGDQRLAWMAYRLPKDVLTSSEVLLLDLTRSGGTPGELYGPMAASLLAKIKKFHDSGCIHGQPHSGNWFGCYSNGIPDALLTDWETRAELHALPSSTQLLALGAKEGSSYGVYFAGMKPPEMAVALDVFLATRESAKLINSEPFKRMTLHYGGLRSLSFEVDPSQRYVTRSSLEFQCRILAHAISGYGSDGGTTPAALDKATAIFIDAIGVLGLRVADMQRMPIYGRTYEALFDVDWSIAVNYAFEELNIRIARIAAANSDLDVLKLLLDRPELLTEEPNYFLKPVESKK